MFPQVYLTHLEPTKEKKKKYKRKNILTVFADWFALGSSFNTYPGFVQLYLSFYFLLGWSQNTCQIWKRRLLRPFRSMCPALGYVHGFLNSLVYAEALGSSSTFISSCNLFLSGLLGLFIVCPKCCALLQLLWPVPVPLDVFSRSHPGTYPSSANAQSWTKQREAFAPVLDGSCQTGWYNHSCLRIMSVLLPSKMHQEYGLLLS